MPNFNSGLWAKMDDPVARSLDGRDAIVQKEYLPLPFQLAINRSANDSFIIGRDNGFYGQTVERRGLNCGHVFYAYQREVERAWNWRGRERQHIDQLKEFFEFLLVQNSEALFLIDHHQAEILEYNVAGHEPVSANDDVDPAFTQQLQHFLLLGLRAKAAEHFDAHRVIEHALPEHFEMLLSENGGRREHGHLFAIHDRFERGANC